MCCTISYQKCVCFLLLVVLAVLSCSGFRIDNLAMTDVSKKHQQQHVAAPAPEAFFSSSSSSAHRLRHRRASGRRRPCPDIDVRWKAYRSDAIAEATVEGSRCPRNTTNCTVQFKIHRWLKEQHDDTHIRLNFIRPEPDRRNCDDPKAATYRPYFLVKSKSHEEQSKKYILFMKTVGPHEFHAVFTPEVSKNKTETIIKKIIPKTFKARNGTMELTVKPNKLSAMKRRLKLICKVKGLPIPLFTWNVNHIPIDSNTNNRTTITQKKKKSVLVIKNATDAELRAPYECKAESVNGVIVRKTKHPLHPLPPNPDPFNGVPCHMPMQQNYCDSGGECFYLPLIDIYGCRCLPGFKGERCDLKSPDQTIQS